MVYLTISQHWFREWLGAEQAGDQSLPEQRLTQFTDTYMRHSADELNRTETRQVTLLDITGTAVLVAYLKSSHCNSYKHDDVIKCKHFPRYTGHLCGEFTGHR